MKLTILPLTLLLGVSAAVPSPIPHAFHAASLEPRRELGVEQPRDITEPEAEKDQGFSLPDNIDASGNPIVARTLAQKRQNEVWTEDELDIVEACFTDCLISGEKEGACICQCIYAGNCDKGNKDDS